MEMEGEFASSGVGASGEGSLKKRLTVSQTLLVNFGVILVLVGLLTYSSVDTTRRLGGMLDREVNENARIADLTDSIKMRIRLMKEFSLATQFAYAAGKVLQVNSSHAHNARSMGECSVCHAFGLAQEKQADFAKLAQQATRDADELLPLVPSDQTREMLRGIRGSITEWQQVFQHYLELVSAGDFAGGHGLVMGDMAPLLEKIEAAAGKLEAEQQKQRAGSQISATKSEARSKWITFALLGVSVLCGVFLVAAIRRVNRELRRFAVDLRSGARAVSEEAEVVRQASQELGRDASAQAASIEETLASSGEVNAVAQSNAEHSAKVSELIQGVRREMEHTTIALGQTRDAMKEIGESSEHISKIIKVIDEIAFQTNLLALNAAVEAARAGESGMGFAVVADEVRALAQRCSVAARDTTQLVEESIARSEQGRQRVDQLSTHIRSISDGTQAVTVLAEQVQAGSLEQARAMQQIGGALERMQSSTIETAAKAETSAETGQRLSEEANALKSVVDGMDALVGAGGDEAAG